MNTYKADVTLGDDKWIFYLRATKEESAVQMAVTLLSGKDEFVKIAKDDEFCTVVIRRLRDHGKPCKSIVYEAVPVYGGGVVCSDVHCWLSDGLVPYLE